MKRLKGIIIISLLLISNLASSQTKTEKIKVLGNCGMCKKRIETGLKELGVGSAVWDKSTKILTIDYDSTQFTSNMIHEKIASLGHDTQKAKAKTDVYDKLPGCCKYDRTGQTEKAH